MTDLDCLRDTATHASEVFLHLGRDVASNRGGLLERIHKITFTFYERLSSRIAWLPASGTVYPRRSGLVNFLHSEVPDRNSTECSRPPKSGISTSGASSWSWLSAHLRSARHSKPDNSPSGMPTSSAPSAHRLRSTAAMADSIESLEVLRICSWSMNHWYFAPGQQSTPILSAQARSIARMTGLDAAGCPW